MVIPPGLWQTGGEGGGGWEGVRGEVREGGGGGGKEGGQMEAYSIGGDHTAQ